MLRMEPRLSWLKGSCSFKESLVLGRWAKVSIELNWNGYGLKLKSHSHAIKLRVSLVDSRVMIWAENHYVLFFIKAASAKPFDMVPFG